MTKSDVKKFYTVRAVYWNPDEEKRRIGVKLEVTEGPDTGKVGWYNGDFREGWADRTIEALKLLGWDGLDWKTFSGLGSCLAEGVMMEDEWPPGTIKEVFKYINSYKPPERKAAAPKGFSSGFAAKYAALAKSVKVDIDPSAKIAETTEDPF